LKGVLIDTAHGVVDEETAQKKTEEEDSRIVIDVLVHTAKSFCIDDQSVHCWVIRIVSRQQFSPDPKTLLNGVFLVP
jgi:hypothetical protein